ncbi:MAG: hypothetical protein AABY22_26575 [Nanoarchaeota archaeon]
MQINKKTEKFLDWMVNQFNEQNRLEKLSNIELVEESLENDVSDSLIVQEMMNRLYPDWYKDGSENKHN